MDLKIGCCGWGYFSAKQYFGEDWKNKFKSKLQAYASKFDLVEINSTFYKLPKVTTAEKWREEAKSVNREFEFTVKASQLITHNIVFSKKSIPVFESMKRICKALNARILLFQSPASFKPTNENVKKMREFFENIQRNDLILVWEPRGDWHKNPNLIEETCKEFELVECVDPFANQPVYFRKERIAYFRLHGKPPGKQMYKYDYKKQDLKKLKSFIEELPKLRETYVMFNNIFMYKNALEFMQLLGLKNRKRSTKN
jgi:uncharacterized protein YecE (DUF72 family)